MTHSVEPLVLLREQLKHERALKAHLFKALKGLLSACELYGADSFEFFEARNVALAVIAKAGDGKSCQ